MCTRYIKRILIIPLNFVFYDATSCNIFFGILQIKKRSNSFEYIFLNFLLLQEIARQMQEKEKRKYERYLEKQRERQLKKEREKIEKRLAKQTEEARLSSTGKDIKLLSLSYFSFIQLSGKRKKRKIT